MQTFMWHRPAGITGVYTFKNNFLYRKGEATSQNPSYVGGIIGFYDSLNRIDAITNNYYSKDCVQTKQSDS